MLEIKAKKDGGIRPFLMMLGPSLRRHCPYVASGSAAGIPVEVAYQKFTVKLSLT